MAIARHLKLEPGHEILMSDQEYPPLLPAWRQLCLERRISLRKLPPAEIPGALSSRTGVVILSHVACLTGRVLPLQKILERANSAGVPTIVDGAHASGHLAPGELNVPADFYVGSLSKWLSIPRKGAYIQSQTPLTSRLQWLERGLGEIPEAPLSLPEAIDFWKRDRSQTLQKTSELRHFALESLPYDPVDSTTGAAQILSLYLPASLDLHRLQQHFRRERIQVLVARPTGRPLLRLCFQSYNTPEDICRLTSSLALFQARYSGVG